MKFVRGLAIGVLQIISLAIVVVLLPLKAARKLAGKDSRRSLWTGTPILTMATNAKAERLLGCRASSLVTHTYYITDAFDYDLSRWRQIRIVGTLITFGIFIWACLTVDRLHFYFDQGILPSYRRFTFNFFELHAYRLLGIDVFLWSYGADVRSRRTTQALGEPNCCTDCTQIGSACVCDEATRVSYVEKLRKMSRATFSMGDMIEYTPGSRNDIFFWPIDLQAQNGEKYKPVIPRFDRERPVRIVHASNHRMFKGTRFLERAVEALKADGLPVELVLVEKVPNAEALEIYRSADIIFDQCLIGFHGYFALEGMALGKPVMCFIREPHRYLLAPDECPIVNTHVTTLKHDLRQLVGDRARITQLGRLSRLYVEKYFGLQAFASRLQKAYEDLGVKP